MLRNIFYIIISVVVLIVFWFQLLVIRKQSNLVKKLYNDIEQVEHQVNILKHNYYSSWKLERAVLNLDEIYDEDDHKVDSFYNQEHPILLFRFSSFS